MKYDETFNLIVNSAVRYALGRRTYIVSATCDYIKEHIKELSDKTLNNIEQDISKQDNLGDSCDVQEWMQLVNFIREEKIKRGLFV